MAPACLFGVMHATIISAAVRAVEAAAHGEVDMNVEPTRRIEVDAGYPPWRHKTQCQLQQGWCRT
jgi:hypothetical protein